MKDRNLVYILFAVLIISLVGNEILYENILSLQKDIKGYSDANNQLVQKASQISLTYNKTSQDQSAP